MKKILIVEDEVIIGLDISNKLTNQGYDVIDQVTTPEEALEVVSSERPDLILMDINLKADIDGIELAGKIREADDIPCVFLTSYSDSATIERSMSTEPYGYIIKPYTEGTLLAALRTSFTRIDLEQRLIKQRAMFKNVMNNTTDGIVVVTRQGEITLANEVFCEMMNLTDPVGSNIESVADGSFSMDFINKLYTNNISEMAFLHVKGDKNTILVSANNLTDEHGDSILLTLTDLTEIETIKDALSEAEIRFTKIFRKNMVPAALLTYPEMNISEVNEAFQMLYGIKEEDCLDKCISDIISEEILGLIRSSLDENNSFRLDIVGQKKVSGDTFFSSISGKMVTFDKVDYLLTDFYDITEQVRVSEMEKELQQKLIHANKMTSMGTLVSGVAHEINNPNNFIMFNSSLLLEFWEDAYKCLEKYCAETGEGVGGMSLEDYKEDVEKLIAGICNGSERIKSIVQDLKGFTKQSGPEQFEPVSVEDALNTSIRILNHQITKATENFVINIDSPIPLVMGNIQKLEQVFINILINSLEAISGRMALVEIRCHANDKSVFVEFHDQGLGISSENVSRITEPFFTTKQQEGGTGLGMSIVYSIVKDHGGILDIQSVLGEGTVVTIELPIGEGNER